MRKVIDITAFLAAAMSMRHQSKFNVGVDLSKDAKPKKKGSHDRRKNVKAARKQRNRNK